MGAAGEEFDAWVASTAPRLHRTAYLLVGDWALAQDLVQQACVATWPRFHKLDSPEAFARTVMTRQSISWWRRSKNREIPVDAVPESPDDPWVAVDRREALDRAMRSLPPKQRAVLVLRYVEDLSEADTAAALGWPLGTVKSTTTRALAALRSRGLEDVAR